jgi:hypothetical protein
LGHTGKKKGQGGWAGPEERREEEKRDLFFFQTLFQLFKPLNLNFSKLFQLLNSFQNLNTSSLFQNFQNNLKTFETSHKQTIKPCIQIMMHKHLLILKLLK